MNGRRIVVGDIHGCYKSLYNLLTETIKINKNDQIYFLGDFIDRGHSSKQVVNYVIELLIKGYNVKCLLGNHEQLLLESINNAATFSNWYKSGGKTTLDSFGIHHPIELKKKYICFFENLFNFIELDDYILVHGGLNFNCDNPLTDISSMCWIRNLDPKEIDIAKINNKKIIVGHTPINLKVIKESLNSNRIVVDGGCVYKNSNDNLGYLVALDIDSMQLFTQKNIE